LITVEGGIKKKTILNKSTRLNNKLALKIQNFSMNIPPTGALVLVQTNQSEHFNLTQLYALKK
jgi:hypothetical protein